jgi:hypothetical protein
MRLIYEVNGIDVCEATPLAPGMTTLLEVEAIAKRIAKEEAVLVSDVNIRFED